MSTEEPVAIVAEKAPLANESLESEPVQPVEESYDISNEENFEDATQDDDVYKYLVVDSGPIIRHTGISSLWKKAKQFYTVPAVLKEIRDAKAREHLDALPFDLIPREPSPEGIHAMSDFARKTGDFQSLSVVDLQVLGLLYDLEREGCGGNLDHLRKTPKRVLGLGKIESLCKQEEKTNNEQTSDGKALDQAKGQETAENPSLPQNTNEQSEESAVPTQTIEKPSNASSKPRTWAALVSPLGSNEPIKVENDGAASGIANNNLNVTFGKMNLLSGLDNATNEGQFSDADEESLDESENKKENDSGVVDLEDELKSDFPSLSAAMTVPYEGSDDEDGKDDMPTMSTARIISVEKRRQWEEEQKRKSLQPVSKSGKLYNSFKKYGDLVKPKPATKKTQPVLKKAIEQTAAESVPAGQSSLQVEERAGHSRIVGGVGFSGQDDNVEDDGEGWITCTKDIKIMKAAGALQPTLNPSNLGDKVKAKDDQGPAASQRAACATTDFAMQNVILQMNLELLSVDGMKVRKLKNWVTRCGACFKVYTSSEYHLGGYGSKRLFCDHCGSDMMQRIAASIDGKTGRLKLHLSRRYKNNLRGTKYSLPKPGKGNRFQGDLLLREDQLMMGAWQQKVKMRSGGKAKSAAPSMFGNDIATNVGCVTRSMTTDDIRVGFGRRNPNAAKGRERRGKKKKSSDKACGLRRY